MEISTTKLKIAMVRKGWNSPKLAEEANCSVDTIFAIISKRRKPSIATLSKICKALEIDPEILIE